MTFIFFRGVQTTNQILYVYKLRLNHNEFRRPCTTLPQDFARLVLKAGTSRQGAKVYVETTWIWANVDMGKQSQQMALEFAAITEHRDPGNMYNLSDELLIHYKYKTDF